MARSGTKASRLADQIQRDLSKAIRTELKDRRVGMITLTGVELSPDLSHAKIFFTTLGDDEARLHTQTALDHATGFLRSQLARALTTRTVPQLHFHYDESVERGARLSRLIDEAVGTDHHDPE
ncbi:MAG: 30S ribosome-binding factor RbfA [Betaproteobacteria bacterium]